MKPFLRDLRHGLRIRAQSPVFRSIAILMLSIGAITAATVAPVITAASAQNSNTKSQGALPSWEQRPVDLRAAVETNRQALRLITAVFAARLRRGEVESKFTPKIAPPDTNDPLSGPNDLAMSPLLQDFGQGAVWLSVILSADKSDLSPRLQQVQQSLLEGLGQVATAKPGDVKKQIRKAARSKELEESDTAQDIQRVLQAERNYQEVVSQLRSAFPTYAELYLHQSPRLLNRQGMATVFELCDPAVSADPLQKNERMQASLIVKVYQYDQNGFKIVSFWLYRNIEDPEIFVPRALYSEKGKDVTRNSQSRWDDTHMPPRTFSSVAYVSQAVTALTLKFVDGEPVVSGRSVPPGRHRAQPVDLAGLDVSQLNPAGDSVLDISVPSFAVVLPEIPQMPVLALKNPRMGRDYMPRIRESYEFRTQAEYEAYLIGIKEGMTVLPQSTEIAVASSFTKAEPAEATLKREPPVVPSPKPPVTLIAPVNAEQLNAIYLDPNQPGRLNELSALARDSLKQYPDLRPVPSRNLANELVKKSNASLKNHDRTAELLQQKLLKVREVNVYFLASENTTASWRGPDDVSGKGGIIVVLPNRYYFDSQQFYRNAAGALINQPVTSEEVGTVSNYLGGAAAQPAMAVKQFTIETEYVDHGWDENGDMRRWADEAVDFFKHLREAIVYSKPRLETMAPDKRAALEREIPVVEAWLSSLGDDSVTVNFGLYKGKNDAPPQPKVDTGTRTIWISCKADDFIKSEQKEYRWPLLAKIIEGFSGLQASRFDPGIVGAVYDILTAYSTDKDNKLMIAWRLNSDLPAKPADWPTLAGVPVTRTVAVQSMRGESRSVTAASPASGVDPVATERAEQTTSGQVQKNTTEIGPAPQPVVASAKAVSPVPQLQERQPKAVQSARTPEAQWADPVFGKQVAGLISSHRNGLGDSSLRGIVLRTMMERLIIVRDSNQTYHSKVSSLELKEPSPDHFDLTVNKTSYFDALFALGEKDKMAYEVVWSSLEANLATVEYAAGNPDFGAFYTTVQADLTTVVKRYTHGSAVSPAIFDDPQFKALLPYYTTFWSNWQFAGERARFQYLHDHVSSKRLRQLADEAGNRPETKAVKGDLQRLADEVDLFYGDVGQAANPILPVEGNAGLRANSLDATSIRKEALRETEQGKESRPVNQVDYNMTQVISLLQKVDQPAAQRSQYQDNYRRAFIIRLLLDAWGRTEHDKQKKFMAGEWAGADLRFVLAVLAELQAKRIGSELDNEAILRISKDMPWIADPKFDLTKGAWNRLPDTLKLEQ